MLKPTSRPLVVVALLLLPLLAFATSSALGAHPLRHETKRAAHRRHHRAAHAADRHRRHRAPERDPPTEPERPTSEPPPGKPPVEKEQPKSEPPVEKEQPKSEPPAEKEQPKTEPPAEKEQPKSEPPPKEEPSTQTNCVDVPSACGYPDATNTGVPTGTTLTSRSGEVSVTKAGTTVRDLAVTGEVLVEADNTTLEDDEVTAPAGSGNRGIYIAPGVTGTVIDHVTCHGAGKGTQYCVFNKDSSTKIEDSYLYDCGECLNGPGTITNSFFDVTAVISGEHYEDIYYGGGEGSLIVDHDTMLNPQGQTATVFASTDFGNQTTLTITNNLLAGGGYTLYGGTSCTTGGCGSVTGPVTVTGNRFSDKYYPESGYYGVGAYFDDAATTWSGNVWDSTLKAVPKP
jgi:outer membrane biosynthesis protein TonB